MILQCVILPFGSNGLELHQGTPPEFNERSFPIVTMDDSPWRRVSLHPIHFGYPGLSVQGIEEPSSIWTMLLPPKEAQAKLVPFSGPLTLNCFRSSSFFH